MITQDVVNNLNFILEKNDLSLVNDFEEEFFKLIQLSTETEISLYKIFGQRLIKDSYYLILALYGEKANICHFKTLLSNENDKGREMVIEFRNKDLSHILTKRDKDDITFYILMDYYSGMSNYKTITKTYENTTLIRHLIDEIVS